MSKIIKQEELEKRRGLSDLLADRDEGHIYWDERALLTSGDMKARDEVKKLLDEAKEEGQRIRNKAKMLLEQVENERETARSQGYEKGYQEGMAQATELMAAAKAFEAKTVAEAETELIALAFEAVKKVIGRAAREGVVKEVVREALETAVGESLVVRVHPDDRSLVDTSTFLGPAKKQLGKRIQVIEDASVGRGGCIVESELGTVDARLEVQLEALAKAFGGL